MPNSVSATDIFKFVTEVFDSESGDDDLQYALILMMASVDEEDPKQLVKQFGIVMSSYSSFILTKIAKQLDTERSQAIDALHDASIVAQGGT